MRKYLMGVSLLAVAGVAPAHAGELKLKPIVDARLRYETVDQTGIAKNADSVTLRLRAGGEVSTGPWAVLVEGEGTIAMDSQYNSALNGKTAYPVVADPENVELNRVQIQYKGIDKTVVTVGRQRINLDDQRFVGSVGWRQNEQTFDAARIEWTGIKKVKLDVTYAWSDRTIWGVDGIANTPNATSIDGKNVFGTLSYASKYGTLTGFMFLVDQDEPSVALLRRSSQTYGARFAGAYPFSKKIKLNYAVSFARQSDYNKSPLNYSADYVAAELGLTAMGFKLTGGYELLGSDATATGIAGGFAFQTPFATGHKFNGWADKFLNTPATGLQDYYGSIGYTFPKMGSIGPLTAVVAYHRFDSDRLSINYGHEWDAQASMKLTKQLNLTAKYADYQRKGIASFPGDADTKKFIAQLDYSL